MRYRVAALGVIAGLAFLLWFSVRMGMQAWLAAAFLLIYFILALAVTRMRAQFGAPIHDLLFTEPDRILTALIGTRAIPKQDLIGMAMYFWFTRTYRPLPMAHQMEALKMQDLTADSHKGVVQALVLATLLGFATGIWTCLQYNYNLGASAGGFVHRGNESFDKLSTWLTAPEGTRWGPVLAMGVGAGVAFFLQTMRLRFVAWPFHPLGFAISGAWEMNVVWLQLFIAWLIKTVVTKYGGHKAYRRMTPFFLGLIMAQCVVGSIAGTIGLALHRRLYKLLAMQ